MSREHKEKPGLLRPGFLLKQHTIDDAIEVFFKIGSRFKDERLSDIHGNEHIMILLNEPKDRHTQMADEFLHARQRRISKEDGIDAIDDGGTFPDAQARKEMCGYLRIANSSIFQICHQNGAVSTRCRKYEVLSRPGWCVHNNIIEFRF